MEANEKLHFLEKIKAVAMSLVGTAILTQGLLYFQPQKEYRVPRILYPVLEFAGYIGLAVGMVILGGALLYYAYTKWKSNGGKAGIYSVIIIVFILIFGAILFSTQKPANDTSALNSFINTKSKSDENSVIAQETDETSFRNPAITEHFKNFEKLYDQKVLNTKNGDAEALKQGNVNYHEWSKAGRKVAPDHKDNAELEKFFSTERALAKRWHDVK